jgi:hypothetical protein
MTITLQSFITIQAAMFVEEHIAQGNLSADVWSDEIAARDALNLKEGDETFDGFWKWNGRGLELTPKGKATDLVMRELLSQIHVARCEIEFLENNKHEFENDRADVMIFEKGELINRCANQLSELFAFDINTFTFDDQKVLDLL